jgi:hypothetical protein
VTRFARTLNVTRFARTLNVTRFASEWIRLLRPS